MVPFTEYHGPNGVAYSSTTRSLAFSAGDPLAEGVEREYVLLRVDIDRTSTGTKIKTRALPNYIIYDCDQQDRFQLFRRDAGARFLSKLDLAKEGMPFMLRAADLLAEKKDAEAWISGRAGRARPCTRPTG